MPDIMPIDIIQELEFLQPDPPRYDFLEHRTKASVRSGRWNIRRYEHPSEDTIFPREYAFYLLDELRGRTVVALGCGDGFSTVVPAALGARVIAVDASDDNLAMTRRRANFRGLHNSITLLQSDGSHIPIGDAHADRVLWTSILECPDPLAMARQIRRILKPGGSVVFFVPVRGFALTKNHTRALSRAVGTVGRSKEFWLTTGLLCRGGVSSASPLCEITQRLDAAVLRRFPFARSFASSLVWEARKES